jgi:hypothetical protein
VNINGSSYSYNIMCGHNELSLALSIFVPVGSHILSHSSHVFDPYASTHHALAYYGKIRKARIMKVYFFYQEDDYNELEVAGIFATKDLAIDARIKGITSSTYNMSDEEFRERVYQDQIHEMEVVTENEN